MGDAYYLIQHLDSPLLPVKTCLVALPNDKRSSRRRLFEAGLRETANKTPIGLWPPGC